MKIWVIILFISLVVLDIPSAVIGSQHDIIFQDDFTTNQNRWDEWNQHQCNLEVKNGIYLFESTSTIDARWRSWKTIEIDQNQDFQIEVTLEIKSGAWYESGLIWGVNAENYYYFLLGGNGVYTYGKRVNNTWYDIYYRIPSNTIKQGNAKNTISIRKSGYHIKFFINNHDVNTAEFEEFFGNAVGFFFRGTTKIAIDNLMIRQSSKRLSSSLGKRVALVIGNSDYAEVPLRNPANDAEDIANMLQLLGFTVTTKININQQEMEEAINIFVQQIHNGDVALFYFSGHGVQAKGENYLLPIGESLQSESDIRYKAVNAGYILGRMEESENRTNIFILDACRNNPFKGLRSLSKGLTIMDAPGGTFIAYATAPGTAAEDGTGRNSPYTKHLIETLKIKGIPIEQTFKHVLRAVEQETAGRQIPWISSSLREDFYFSP